MNTQQKQLLGAGALGVGGLVLYSRMRAKRAGGTAAGPAVATSGGDIQPYTPQTPLTLDPGQSVYDPNSEGLLGTGFAPGTGQTTFDPGQTVYDPSAPFGTPQNPGFPSPPPPPQTSGPSQPGYVVNVTNPPPAGTHHPKRRPGRGLATGPAPAKGAKPAVSGPHKPKPPAGYHTVGTGKGNWWFVPNPKKPKPKGAKA